jgi:stage III sporulation protein AE
LKKIRILITAFIICMAFTLFPHIVYAENDVDILEVEEKVRFNIQSTVDRQLTMMDIADIEKAYGQYFDELGTITNSPTLKRFISDMASGKADIDIGDVLTLMAKLFFAEVSKNVAPILMIIVIAALFSILNDFRPKLNETQIDVVTTYVQYILVIGIATKVLISCFNMGQGAIATLSDFTQSLFPVLATLTVSMGGIVSASIFTPVIAFLTSFVTGAVQNTFMPMVLILLVFAILDNISDKISVSNFSAMIKSVFKWGLGIIFVIFLGVIKIKGLVGSSFDGVSIKMTKFTISKLVPFIGGAISDTVDTVAVCSLLLKNAIGISGLVIMFVIVLKPVLNIAGCNILIKLASSVLQPIAGKRIVTVLDHFSDVLTHLLILVIVAGAMFFITVGLIISTGNMNIMIR